MSNEEKKIFDWIKAGDEEGRKWIGAKTDEDIQQYIEILKEGETGPEQYIQWCGFGDALQMIDEGKKFDSGAACVLHMLMETK